MDDDEDEIDILGDFDLENLLTRRDRTQSSYSFSSNDNYSFPTSDWILENSSPLFNVKSVLTSDQVIYDVPPLFPSTECLDVNSNVWTDKEKTLLERGLDLFGKSYVRLSQYIGTKNSSQVKTYMRNYYPRESLASASSTNSLNCLDVGTSDLDTIEVVVSSADTPPPPVPPPSYELSSLSEGSFDSDSYMGSTTSTASESERKTLETVRPPKPKVKKLVKKKAPPLQPEKEEETDDDMDYDNTNIIFKPRKLSKYHLMVKAGDQVLPSGEQVIRIKKDDSKSDSDVDVLESDDAEPTSSSVKPSNVDVNTFHPDCGMKISGIVQCRRIEQPQPKITVRPVEEVNVDVEVDVENDVADVEKTEQVPDERSTLNVKEKVITNISCTLLNEDSYTKPNIERSNKRTGSTKNTKTRKKIKPVVVSNRKSSLKSAKPLGTKSSENRNVYLNKPNLLPTSKRLSSAHDTKSELNSSEDDFKSKTRKKIVFEESQFRTERSKAMHVDDLLENYDFSNVRLIDHATQMQRIAQLGPVATLLREDRTFNNYISIEEIDYHRDFFLHNDPYFVMRFLKIRNYILREWSCKKPKYINKTTIRSGLKHCGSAVLIMRVHSYLEQRGLINT